MAIRVPSLLLGATVLLTTAPLACRGSTTAPTPQEQTHGTQPTPAAPAESPADPAGAAGVPGSTPPAGSTRPMAPSLACTARRVGPGGGIELTIENRGALATVAPDPTDPAAVTVSVGGKVVSAAVPGRPPRTRIVGPGARLTARIAAPQTDGPVMVSMGDGSREIRCPVEPAEAP